MKATYDIYDLDTLVDSVAVSFEEGDTVLDVLVDNFDVRKEKDKDIIKTISGYEQNMDINEFWLFSVNSEFGKSSADEYELGEGDIVEWTLTRFE